MKLPTLKEAKAQGYKLLAGPYELPMDEDMLQGVLRDLQNIPHVLVFDKGSHWVCRTAEGWLSGNNEGDLDNLEEWL